MKEKEIHEQRINEWHSRGDNEGYTSIKEYRIPETYDSVDCAWFSERDGTVLIEVEMGKFSPQVWKNMTKALFMEPKLLIFDCEREATAIHIKERSRFIHFPIKIISRENSSEMINEPAERYIYTFLQKIKNNPFKARDFHSITSILDDTELYRNGVDASNYRHWSFRAPIQDLLSCGLIKEIKTLFGRKYMRNKEINLYRGFDTNKLRRAYYCNNSSIEIKREV